MASVRKRAGKWEVQIRRKGFPSITKTFHAKEDAQRWAREQERRLDMGEVGLPTPQPTDLPVTLFAVATVATVIERYRDEVLPTKRAAGAIETFHLRAILRHPASALKLTELTPAALATYRDERLAQVSSSTVRRELGLIQHAFTIARNEWGLPAPDLAKTLRKPSPNKSRNRRLEPAELIKLKDALAGSRNKLLSYSILFAVHTGVRRGELLALRWSDVDLKLCTAHLRMTKNGEPRTIPLSPAAIRALPTYSAGCEFVFPMSANALRLAWERLKRRAGVEDLHFHDLRHEAISRFFEYGLSVPEVSLISGHKDPRMLLRYTHLKAKDVAVKLHRAKPGD